MNKEEILRVIPHRPPMLFVDDIEEVVYKERVRGVKVVSADEPWAQGHFPGDPVFPGTLMTETMAQIGCFLYYHGSDTGVIRAYLSKLEDIKLLKTVRPGDRIVVEGSLVQEFGDFSKIKCAATVNGEVVAKGFVTYFFPEGQR